MEHFLFCAVEVLILINDEQVDVPLGLISLSQEGCGLGRQLTQQGVAVSETMLFPDFLIGLHQAGFRGGEGQAATPQ
ncbi:hypothetical protein AWB90_01295 [Mycobacterium paraense]|uniref:Uncharacterized protein n=1 Tax=Mycobacterium paraense TaxID=767916 RepID=A0A1X2AQU8_9MYCO|nr:hypothetical protein AWB90_01295 [Mycobacterium paraense]